MSDKYYNDEITSSISSVYEGIISKLGEDPKREGLLKTPERVAKALQFLTHGYVIQKW
jgi:GTP cyclohydrolase I